MSLPPTGLLRTKLVGVVGGGKRQSLGLEDFWFVKPKHAITNEYGQEFASLRGSGAGKRGTEVDGRVSYEVLET